MDVVNLAHSVADSLNKLETTRMMIAGYDSVTSVPVSILPTDENRAPSSR